MKSFFWSAWGHFLFYVKGAQMVRKGGNAL